MGVCIGGFCNVLFCVYMRVCKVWVCVCLSIVMCVCGFCNMLLCVYVWVL